MQEEEIVKVLTCGTIMVDILTVNLEKIAKPGEVVYLDSESKIRIGGHPIDVAIDLVKLGMAPAKVGVVAAIGEGIFGDYAKKIIKQYNIPVFAQKVNKIDTGTNVVLERKNEDRRFHISPGANWYLDAEFVKRKIKEESPKIFCIRPGYCGIDLKLEEIFVEAKKYGSFLFLDIMKFHPLRPKNILLPLFHFVDAVHCNQEEAMINTGKKSPREAVREMIRLGVKIVFLTKGHNGTDLITRDLVISQPGFKVKSIDNTGCGDAFCAGVTYQLIERGDYKNTSGLSQDKLVELLIYAQATGASASTACGCTDGVSRNLVGEIIKNQKNEILNETIIKSGY